MDVLLHRLYYRQLGDEAAATTAAFAAVARAFTDGAATPEMWHMMPYVYEAYAGHPVATAAVARILAPANLTRATLSKLAGYNWLSRTCCLLQAPAALIPLVARFTKLRVSITAGNIVTLLTLVNAEVPSCVRLHCLLLQQLATHCPTVDASITLPAIDRSLRLAMAVGDARLLCDLLARVLAAVEPDALPPLMHTLCRALDAAASQPRLWTIVAAAVKRLSPGHATLVHWSAWFEARLFDSPPVAHLPAALHALAAYAENASIGVAARILHAFFVSDAAFDAAPWSAALLFAVARVVSAVQAVDRAWTCAAVARLCGEGPHLTGLKGAFYHMRLPRQFRRAHMGAWASLCCLWRTYRPLGARCALTTHAWRCYRGTAKFWGAAALLCDARDVGVWAIWLRRQLRCRGGALPPQFYTHVINAMITECERDGVANSSAFLQSLITDVPKHSPMYPWLLGRLLATPALPKTVFTKMIPVTLSYLERLESRPAMVNAFVDTCLRWGLVLTATPLFVITIAKLRRPQLTAEEACPLLRLLSLYASDVLATQNWAPLLTAPWATPWTRTMVLALIAVCPWEPEDSPALIRTALAEWRSAGCPPAHYGHIALAGLGSQVADPEVVAACSAALEVAVGDATPYLAGPLLAAVGAHVRSGAGPLSPAAAAYFEAAAGTLLPEGYILAVDILSSLPLRRDCLGHMSRQTLWVPASALAGSNWQLQAGLCLRALASPIPLTAAEAALVLEALCGGGFPYSLADMAALTAAAAARWPACRRQCTRLLTLAAARAAAGGVPSTPCSCAGGVATCYHATFAFGAGVDASTTGTTTTTAASLTPYECSICYEAITSTAALLLECGHMFHEGCMRVWEAAAAVAGRASSCPMCRRSPVEAACVEGPFPEILPPRMAAMASAIHTF